jgi:uncharacterized protein (UPF0303 family)
LSCQFSTTRSVSSADSPLAIFPLEVHSTYTVAWELGTLLRARFIKEKVPSGHSAAIQIRAFPEGHPKHASILFATTVGSVPPGIGSLVAGKANVVKWSGTSTYLTRTR